MKDIIVRLIKELGFQNGIKISCGLAAHDVLTYTNNLNDETYILDFVNNLNTNTLDEILKILQTHIYTNELLSKSEKTNISLILICRYDGKYSEVDRNIILKIEENTLFCQKFVLWYTEDELNEVKKIFADNSILEVLNNVIMSKDVFKTFKDNKKDKEDIYNQYAIVSRIFIKIPFMTLANVEVLTKGISSYTADNLNKLGNGFYERLKSEKSIQEEYFNDTIEMVSLTDKEIKEIEIELRKVGAVYAE